MTHDSPHPAYRDLPAAAPDDDAGVLRVNPERLKGLSHPIRVEILDQLVLHGASTASKLAERVGESSGSTSYHLRQLERHGFVEEEEGKGHGRERWWRVVKGGMMISPTDVKDDPVALAATEAVVQQVVGQRARQLHLFVKEGLGAFGLDWVESSAIVSSALSVTREELEALSEEIQSAIDAATSAYRGREGVQGTRRVMIQFNAFPIVGGPVVVDGGVAEPGREGS
jgi:DNA-binding transcriptional ArsR family regulator